MTPKEKADELVYKFMHAECQYGFINSNKHRSKQYALVAVDEIVEALGYNQWQNRNQINYYKEVKQEIENLQV